HRSCRLRGQKRRVQRNIADVSSSDVQLREFLVVKRARGRSLRERASPDGFALRSIRKWEVDGEAEPALERLIERRAQVGGKDRQPLVRLHALQQISNFDVRVAVVTVPHLAALAEERISLVKQQQHSTFLGRIENFLQILFGLANIL